MLFRSPPTPKYRYLTKVVLKSFPAKKGDGTDWDAGFPGPEPDVILRIRYADNSWSMNTTEMLNLTNASLPKYFSYDMYGIKLTNVNWAIDVLDNDPPALGMPPTQENMATTAAFNPATAAPSSTGVITLSAPGASFEIWFAEY